MKTILVVAEHRSGELRAVTFELIAGAQTLKQGADDQVVVAVIGAQANQFVSALSVEGVNEVIVVKTDSVDFDPDHFENAVSGLIQNKSPAVVLLPHTVDSLGYAATLASKGNFGFATDVFKLEYDGADLVATRGGYNQKVNIEVDFPGKSCVVLAVRANVYKPLEGTSTPIVSSFEP
ncbi:MAG: electron transfer flavoprotein subunit alpha/FixB family protein, partial [Nitrosomonadales bacterium]|nr:electron transfer flavoprotein subunit alpha/FixB family protein [Nitrosomonadales bacterium]